MSMLDKMMSDPGGMWNKRYGSGDGYVYGTEANDFLKAMAAAIPKGPVLCLAAGEGRNAVFLAEQGYEVTAVDLSRVGLDKTAALAKARGVKVTCVEANLMDHDLGDGLWAGITSIWAHTPAEVRKAVHGRLAKALAPGGVFILEHYRPQQIELGTGGPPVSMFLPTLRDLREELGALDLVLAQDVMRDVSEGAGHEGRSATVQVLARRAD
jgi:2-polyprenyl-3-methyl-5-hydroxy-6-metoxy-1,4-benzoquinol methylase